MFYGISTIKWASSTVVSGLKIHEEDMIKVSLHRIVLKVMHKKRKRHGALDMDLKATLSVVPYCLTMMVHESTVPAHK